MINLIDGKINFGAESIIIKSGYEYLNALAEKKLIEKRKDPGKGEDYFYAEAIEDDIRFGAIISLRAKKIDYILFRWLDSPMKGWNDVSENALKDEYHLLLNFVEKRIGNQPDNKTNRQRTWRLEWGEVEVSYEPRSFDAAIFMKPR